MIKERTGYIYCITDKVNCKKYIGQTSVSIPFRWNQHQQSARSGVDTYLYRAMRSHGINSFSIEEICKITLPTEDLSTELDRLETYYIEKYNTYAPNGYNMTHGGKEFSNPASVAVCLVNDDGDILNIYDSIRNASRDTMIDEKTIQHACTSKSHFGGESFWIYHDGVLHVGDNIGKQCKGKNNWNGHTTYVGKPVCALKDGNMVQTYDSASDAARQLNISQAHISKCCNGERKSAGGYGWAFINFK